MRVNEERLRRVRLAEARIKMLEKRLFEAELELLEAKESIKINEAEDEESGFVRDFVDELDADNGLTDEIYEQVTEGRNYSDYQLELIDDAIRHFIDDWRNDSGDVEAETAEEAKQIILDSIGDYLEPNLPEEGDEEDDNSPLSNINRCAGWYKTHEIERLMCKKGITPEEAKKELGIKSSFKYVPSGHYKC